MPNSIEPDSVLSTRDFLLDLLELPEVFLGDSVPVLFVHHGCGGVGSEFKYLVNAPEMLYEKGLVRNRTEAAYLTCIALGV